MGQKKVNNIIKILTITTYKPTQTQNGCGGKHFFELNTCLQKKMCGRNLSERIVQRHDNDFAKGKLSSSVQTSNTLWGRTEFEKPICIETEKFNAF